MFSGRSKGQTGTFGFLMFSGRLKGNIGKKRVNLIYLIFEVFKSKTTFHLSFYISHVLGNFDLTRTHSDIP